MKRRQRAKWVRGAVRLSRADACPLRLRSGLAERLHDAATCWQPLGVRWYDGRVRWLQVSSGTALWYRSGQPVLLLRWVLVRLGDAQEPPRAFFSTCPSDQADDIVTCFFKRWSIETTPDQVRGRLFEESRAHLGFETQRPSTTLRSGRTWQLNGPRRAS